MSSVDLWRPLRRLQRKPLLALLLISSTTSALGTNAPQRHPRRSDCQANGFPSFACILGVRLGRDTEADLERRIGKGVVCTGGHSNSGRGWSFHRARGGLGLYTDGFDLRNDRYILDTVRLSDWRGALGSCFPFTRFRPHPLAKLRRGMSQTEVLRAVQPLGPPTAHSTKEMVWRRDSMIRGRWYDYELSLRFTAQGLEDVLAEGSANPP